MTYRAFAEWRKCKASLVTFRRNHDGFNIHYHNCIFNKLKKFVEWKWEEISHYLQPWCLLYNITFWPFQPLYIFSFVWERFYLTEDTNFCKYYSKKPHRFALSPNASLEKLFKQSPLGKNSDETTQLQDKYSFVRLALCLLMSRFSNYLQM